MKRTFDFKKLTVLYNNNICNIFLKYKMKIAFTIALLLGIVSQADAAKIGRHRHHHHHHDGNLAQYTGGNEAWVDSCSPSRNLKDATYGSGTQGAPNADGKGSYEGVGVDC